MSSNKEKMPYTWETKEKFIQWAEAKQKTAQKEAKEYLDVMARGENRDRDIRGNGSRAMQNCTVSVDLFQQLVDDSILKHLNLCYSGIGEDSITIYHIQLFVVAVNNVKFFKKSKLSTDYTRFKEEIIKLKERADNLQYFSESQISIRLPIFPTIIIYEMVSDLQRHGLAEGTLKELHEYFYKVFKISGVTNLPKEPKALRSRQKERTETYNEAINGLRPTETGVWEHEKISLEHIDGIAKKESVTYKPNMNLNYQVVLE